MPIKFSVLTRPLKEKIRNSDHTELKSSGFWIGHLLMILATIIGVYLAAQAGLKQAILFDEITSLQQGHHVRSALIDELQDNIQLLTAYKENYLSKQISGQELQQNNPDLSFYIWTSMQQSPVTLEIPGYFLNGIQRFYRNVNDIIGKAEQRTYAASHARKLLDEQLQQVNSTLLPQLKKNISELEQRLLQHNIRMPDYSGVNGGQQ
ncbi:hypothetical protein [Venatoribacter cucullus]|uniref:hypothetical protein n=1 Tax=Venatoribacter cucullus TaxID=2661630 RepID=UPI00223ED91A|nr:hypothetical protein [Venatoribacter cucullus]UZK04226.1 hypothetical protein GAY96_10095 [Venatoribacter cucullus]